MYRIKNLVNSPYDIRLKGGGVARLPARGEIGPIDIDPLHIPLYRALQYFQITEDTQAVDELKEMRDLYQMVTGKKAYHGWDIKELKERIADSNADNTTEE